MNFPRLLNLVGFGLLGITFLWSAQRALRPAAKVAEADGRITIRFAHWQLEGGLRETLDHLSREYERLHPDVRIEQIAVPERVYSQWRTTQLVGGTVPDLVSLGRGMTDETLARYFVPLTEHVESPNPYNRGTALEGLPLRETFIDGLESWITYNQNLLEYYGVSLSTFTVRVFYNRTLWREVLGDTPPPEDFEEFLSICDRVRDFAEREGRPLIPVAGSRDNAPVLIGRLFSSQTQRLKQRLDMLHELKPTSAQVALGLLRGDWSLDDPAVGRALEISRVAGLNFQPGYTQLGRDDASFYFVQGRALMIATGSWDSTSFRQQAGFEIDAFSIPIPGRDHPRYGAHILGPSSESNSSTGLAFGISRSSPHFDRAFDFLLFLASQPVNAEFSRRSGWLPSVTGITPPAEIRPFLPHTEGYVPGFTFAQFGPDSARVNSVHTNKLVSPAGSVDDFREALAAELPAAIRRDLGRMVRDSMLNIGRQDLLIAGEAGLSRIDVDAGELRLSQLLEAQNRREAQAAWQSHELQRLSPAP
jgi:hypothetical protein